MNGGYGTAPPPSVIVDGVPVNAFTVDSLHAYIDGHITSGSRAKIYHANVHGINLARQDPSFRREMTTADAIFCDGEGVRLASRILGHGLPERITYADWLWQLSALAARRGWSLFFLGGRPGIAERAAKRLGAGVPGLRVAGTAHGYWRADDRTDEDVVAEINASGAQILVVGMGMPLQEFWLGRWWPALQASIGLTGGACFDFVSGEVSRSPSWMRRSGLEWSYRLMLEPRRMFRRYVVGIPQFLGRILEQRLFGRNHY